MKFRRGIFASSLLISTLLSVVAFADPLGDLDPNGNFPTGGGECEYLDEWREMTSTEYNSLVQNLNQTGACTEGIGNLTQMFYAKKLKVYKYYSAENGGSTYYPKGCDEIILGRQTIENIQDHFHQWIVLHEMGHRLQDPYVHNPVSESQFHVDANNYAQNCIEDRNYKYLNGSFYTHGFPSGYENVPTNAHTPEGRAIWGTKTVVPVLDTSQGNYCVQYWLRSTYSNGTVTWEPLGGNCNTGDTDYLEN